MFPLLAVLALGDARVYVYTFDGSDIAFYIEAPVN